MAKQQPHPQPGQPPLTLERIVRDARRQHAQASYPGDLAADLGLDAESPRPARRLWLTRWVPACAAAAALLLGAAVLWQSLTASQPAAPQTPEHVAEADSDDPPHLPPKAHPPAGPTAADLSPAALARAIPPAALDDATVKFSSTADLATHAAEQQLSQDWTGRKTPPAPSAPAMRLRLSLGSIPTLSTSDFDFPRGQRWSVPSLSTLRKELS